MEILHAPHHAMGAILAEEIQDYHVTSAIVCIHIMMIGLSLRIMVQRLLRRVILHVPPPAMVRL
jgi:hypothetical protein